MTVSSISSEMIEELLNAEKVTDVSDQATRSEEEANVHRMIAHQRSMRREQEAGADGTYLILQCDECGLEIGLDRIRVSIKNRHCTPCATAMEKQRGFRR